MTGLIGGAVLSGAAVLSDAAVLSGAAVSVAGNPRVDGEAVEPFGRLRADSGPPGVWAGSRISAMGARSPRKGLEVMSSTSGSVRAVADREDFSCCVRFEEAIWRP